MNGLNKKLYFIILIFMMVYPFLIFPFGNLNYSTLAKLFYLNTFIITIWGVLIIKWLKEKKTPLLLPSKAEKSALLFLVIIGLSTIFSQDSLTSIYGSAYKFQGFIAWFYYISIFFFAYHLIPSKAQLTLIRLIVFASFFVGLYGVIQHFFLNGAGTDFVRSSGFFDNPNHFGSYLVIMMTLALTFYLLAKKKTEHFIYSLIIYSLYLSLIYTATRSAWIGVLCSILFLTILVVRKRRHMWKKWIILLLSLFFVFQLADSIEGNIFSNRMFSIGEEANALIFEDEGHAGSGRWSIWKRTLPLIKEYYLVGAGPGTFTLVFPLTEGETNQIDNSHNDYLEIALTLGVPALLLYLALILTVLKSSFIAIKKLNGDEEIFAWGLFIAIIAYLIKVLFNISVVPVAPFFWLLLGIIYALALKVKSTAIV